MALPNSYTFDNDQLANHAWESVSHNCINLMTSGGETLLPMLAAKGRIFGVPDTEFRRDDFFYQEPGDTTYAGVVPGSFSGVALGHTAQEFSSSMVFSFQEWQNNVPWPTTFPSTGGDLPNAILAHVKAKSPRVLRWT